MRLDWREELKKLLTQGIKVYAVQALGRSHATAFYKEVARITGGFHLELHQFRHVESLIVAACLNQAGNAEVFNQYQADVQKAGQYDRGLEVIFVTLGGRATETSKKRRDGLIPVNPNRFQVFAVDDDTPIKAFVESNGLEFQIGLGFYEFIKSVKVQDYKEVILLDLVTGDMFTGDEARQLLGLPDSGTVSIGPKSAPRGYKVFIQSTSRNRKLIGGTTFLYDIDSLRR